MDNRQQIRFPIFKKSGSINSKKIETHPFTLGELGKH